MKGRSHFCVGDRSNHVPKIVSVGLRSLTQPTGGRSHISWIRVGRSLYMNVRQKDLTGAIAQADTRLICSITQNL
ncbi:MAG: hypothetical protein F6K19_47690, partial [Cyanothece sp. SIO1E1]|nr:hypothetical protein [Cyanothece sp. SIO1E1]